MRFFSFLSLLLFLVFSLSGCMVGPHFQQPPAPKTNTYTQLPTPTHTQSSPGTQAQHFVYGQDIPEEWWTLFHSPALNELIRTGLANSPTLAAARATLKQAEETLRAQIGSTMFPEVSAQLGAERTRSSGAALGLNSPPSIFNLYNTSVNVSYTLDVFGGLRRQIQVLAAQVDYQRYELRAARLTLTANIVTSAINIASLEAQIAATQALIKAEEEQLKVIKEQLGLGGVSETNVLTQATQVAQTRALLPPLEQNLAVAQHALAVLVGSFPSAMAALKLDLNTLSLPQNLPVSLPSVLVRQRPDIGASEALFKAACAQVGVATANLFPQITLNGAYGWQNDALNQLISSSNQAWSLGGQLLQPIFNAGALRATQKAAIANYEATGAQYRQTVLQAFQNVADTLRALENDALALQAQTLAEAAAWKTLKITEEQLKLGGVSYLDLLTAEEQYQQAKIARIQAKAARYADSAALFQAMGGGWWNQGMLPAPSFYCEGHACKS